MATKPLKVSVTETLRQAIWEGRYVAGEWLRQDDLAKKLGVSRMPVREALKQLASEGLVELHPYRGALIKRLSAAELEELFAIRTLLEGEAARRGAPRLTDEQIRNLEEQMRLMGTEVNVSEYLIINRNFHHTIYEASGWTHLLELIDRLRINVDRYLRVYLSALETVDHRAAEHALILEACRRRDGEEAARQTVHHIQATGEQLLRVLRRANLVT